MGDRPTRIAYLTSGAAGMYCGSCMHDNSLTRALRDAGYEARLIPTYTPIRTDEEEVTVDQVFFGGINVFLQQKIPLFRMVPRLLDRFLDNPWLIRKVTSRAIETSAKELGALTVSMLKGVQGNQRKEVKRLCRWLKEAINPDVIILSNILIGGCIEQIKRELQIPVIVTLQGDDIFLESLPEPFQTQSLERIRGIAKHVDAFMVHSQFYAEFMTDWFQLNPDRVHVTPLGIDLHDFDFDEPPSTSDRPPTIGYLARLAPEKGLHQLVDAFLELKQRPQGADVRLLIAGWLGKNNQAFVDEQFERLTSAGLEADFQYLGSIDRDEKLKMLQQIDLLTVPTVYREPKGLYVLESLAASVPVVQPDHGAFPELIEQTGGGVTYEAGNTSAHVDTILRLLADPTTRSEMGRAGRNAVFSGRGGEAMARSTAAVIEKVLGDHRTTDPAA